MSLAAHLIFTIKHKGQGLYLQSEGQILQIRGQPITAHGHTHLLLTFCTTCELRMCFMFLSG